MQKAEDQNLAYHGGLRDMRIITSRRDRIDPDSGGLMPEFILSIKCYLTLSFFHHIYCPCHQPVYAGFEFKQRPALPKPSLTASALRTNDLGMQKHFPQRKANTPTPGLKMNELASATGVPKSTILYYLSQGLLPEPRKTSRNMAYYDPACVERIKLIQQMQERHRLTLSEINHCLNDKERGSDLEVYLELNEEVFGSTGPRRLLDAKNFCRKTGLSADQLEELTQARLLLPLEEGRFDAEDVGMGRMYLAAFNFGIRTQDLTYYAELGDKIVDREMQLRNRMTGGLPYQKDAAATLQLVKNARMCRAYVIDRLFQHRVAAMRDLKDSPPEREEPEPWLD